jgi:hypothetical protein
MVQEDVSKKRSKILSKSGYEDVQQLCWSVGGKNLIKTMLPWCLPFSHRRQLTGTFKIKKLFVTDMILTNLLTNTSSNLPRANH